MSTVVSDNLIAFDRNIILNGNVAFSYPKQIEPPVLNPYKGMVVQCVFKIVHEQVALGINGLGDGRKVDALDISITPKFKSSSIYVSWMINNESEHNTGFDVWKNNGTHWLGRNRDRTNISPGGNYRWSTFASSRYDMDQDTTPDNTAINFIDPTAGSLDPIIYSIAVKRTTSGTQTFYLNRTYANQDYNAREDMVSTVTAWEIRR